MQYARESDTSSCGAAAENIVIAPYSGTEHLASLVHAISDVSTPRPSERTKLAFFRGNCGPWEQVTPDALSRF